MRRLVTTTEGEVRMPSLKGKPKGFPQLRQEPALPRQRGGLTAETAPHKTDMQHFDSKFGGGFGETGME